MKANDLDPGPDRGPDSWQEFLKRHAETLYQCDFFSKRIVTKFGLQQYFVLVFLHLGSRKVYVTKCTRKPLNAEAYRSLNEAGNDLLALHRLNVPNTLDRSLLSTNAIENSFLNTRRKLGRVRLRRGRSCASVSAAKS